MIISAVTDLLSLFTFLIHLGLIFVFGLVVYRIFTNKNKSLISIFNTKNNKEDNLWRKLLKFAKKYGALFAFFVATASMLGSLFYSEFAGYEPCKLCWFQRIFIYPQVLILAIALVKKFKTEFVYYSIVLSIIGALVAVYQYYLQRFSATGAPCSAIDYSASCVKNFVLSFGYITIPMMSLTAYLLIIVSLSFYYVSRK